MDVPAQEPSVRVQPGKGATARMTGVSTATVGIPTDSSLIFKSAEGHRLMQQMQEEPALINVFVHVQAMVKVL